MMWSSPCHFEVTVHHILAEWCPFANLHKVSFPAHSSLVYISSSWNFVNNYSMMWSSACCFEVIVQHILYSISSKPLGDFSCNFAVQLNRTIYRTHLRSRQGLTYWLDNFLLSLCAIYVTNKDTDKVQLISFPNKGTPRAYIYLLCESLYLHNNKNKMDIPRPFFCWISQLCRSVLLFSLHHLVVSSRKHAYIILTPLNPTFI